MKKQTASKDAPKPEPASAQDVSPAYLNLVYALENQEKTIDAFGKAATAKTFSIVERLLGRSWRLWADKRFAHITSMTTELTQLRNWILSTPKFPAFFLPGTTSASLEMIVRQYDWLYDIFQIRDTYRRSGKPDVLEANPGVEFISYRHNGDLVRPTKTNLDFLKLEFRYPYKDVAGSHIRSLPIQAFLITEAWFAELDAAIELLALTNASKGPS